MRAGDSFISRDGHRVHRMHHTSVNLVQGASAEYLRYGTKGNRTFAFVLGLRGVVFTKERPHNICAGRRINYKTNEQQQRKSLTFDVHTENRYF